MEMEDNVKDELKINYLVMEKIKASVWTARKFGKSLRISNSEVVELSKIFTHYQFLRSRVDAQENRISEFEKRLAHLEKNSLETDELRLDEALCPLCGGPNCYESYSEYNQPIISCFNCNSEYPRDQFIQHNRHRAGESQCKL